MDTESDEAGILETLERDVNTLALEKDNHGDEIYYDDVEKTTVLEELPEEQQPKSVGNEASPFDYLPAEVILSIFSFLTLKNCANMLLWFVNFGSVIQDVLFCGKDCRFQKPAE